MEKQVLAVHDGTPPFLLVPAHSYQVQVLSDMVSLEVPVQGTFINTNGEEKSYTLCPEPGVLLTGLLIEVLFALRQYPSLEPNENFMVLGFDVNLESNTLQVVGKLVKVMR